MREEGDVSCPVTVVGIVDNDWRIERLSLGAAMVFTIAVDELIGASFVSLLHPDDLVVLLTALEQAREADVAVEADLRLRDDGWRRVTVLVSPLQPQGGFAFVLGPLHHGSEGARARDLAHQLMRIAREVQVLCQAPARRLAMPVGRLRVDRLTSREWEVMARVRAGARVEQMAAELHLSRSTVRNHLSSIYRKLGVRSMTELLVLLHAGELGEAEPT